MAKFKAGDRVIRTGNSAGNVKTGQIYTVSSISFSDSINASIFRINGDEIYSYTEDGFDLAPSDLPTDRPLTYDETQMLKKGDVVNCGIGHKVVNTVHKKSIYFLNYVGFWSLSSDLKQTNGDIFFVSHGKEESKEEKKEEVARSRYDMPPVTQEGLEKAIKEIRKKEPILEFAMGERKMWRCDFAKEYDVKPVLKSVSQILYGRR